MRLNHTAPDYVNGVIAGLGRTEDVKFSPNNRRLAIVCFMKNEIAVFEISIVSKSCEKKITLSDVAVLYSPCLQQPHAIDFIDDERIIVANREGDATIFELPRSAGGGHRYEVVPVGVVRSGDVMTSPGGVAVTRKERNVCEVLIANNYSNRVTRHLINFNEDCRSEADEVLLKKWLCFPDCIGVSGGWIAVTNHDGHNVLLYDSNVPLGEDSNPDGILSCLYWPHGVRFTTDNRFIFVADYGGLYVHIYRNNGSGWGGVRSPFKSLRVMNDEDFLRGCDFEGPQRGGPKGIDIECSTSTLVTTCEVQPLAFFDVAGIVSLPATSVFPEQISLQMKYELDRQNQVEREVARVMSTLSWRITAPLRSARSLLRRVSLS